MSIGKTDRMIEYVSRKFNALYIESIPFLLNPTGAYLSFSTVISGSEALADFFIGGSDGKTGRAFKEFISAFFDSKYERLQDDLLKLRHRMVHSFSAHEKFVLTHDTDAKGHLELQNDGRIILNARRFFDDFKNASEKYFETLKIDETLRQKFIKVCEAQGVPGPPPPTNTPVTKLLLSQSCGTTNITSIGD